MARRLVRGTGLAAAALTITVAALAVTSGPSAATGPPVTGLRHVGTDTLGPRLRELRFTTPAVEGETRVRILLPDGYDDAPDVRYPVLWLLHGGGGSFRDWVDLGDATALTAGRPLIVVMPDTGPSGGYTDWWNHGAGGPPMWETYHLRQLLPWIDEHYRTIPDRSGRAIAGLSMGGGGAMYYAAAHPDLFVGAAAFSGAVDTNTVPVQLLATTAGIERGELPGALAGPRLTEEVRWRGRNAWDLAPNLAGLFLQLDTGNGLPGGPGGDLGDPVEQQCHEMMTNLHERLVAEGIPHLWNDYGPGGHTWFYWRRDLSELLPGLLDVFAAPPPPPAEVRYRTIEPAYAVHGWDVAIDRPALEFSELRQASPAGFALEGSGDALVTTPPSFGPGQAVVATVADAAGDREVRLVADEAGRLAVPVSLGPGNPYQERSPQGTLWAATVGSAGTWPSVTATVSLQPAPVVPPPDEPAAPGEGGDRLPTTGGSRPLLAPLLALALGLTARRALAASRA